MRSVIEHAGLVAAVEQAADGIVITDTSGTIQYVNPAFTALTGYTRDEAVGQNPRILKSGRLSAAHYEELWSTILSGNVWQGELVNRHKDGSLYNEEMRIAPVHDESGAITGYIAIKHDVTEQRAAQEAQAFLAAIVENSEDAIMATTLEGLIRAWNHGAERVFGYSAEEAIGKHVSMLIAPERLDDLKQFTGQLMQGITVSQYRILSLRKDGSKIHVSVTGSPIRNSAGEVEAMSAVVRDISERWKSEQRLRESEERFRNMADGNPALMWVTGTDGELQFINRAYRELFGTTCQEVQSGRWHLLIHPDDAPAFIAAFHRAVEEHTPFSAEARVRRADGEWRLLGSKAQPRISPEGEYLGMVGLSADITEREQAKRALRDSREFAQSTIDALSSHICVLDETGAIVAVNRAWKDFAEANRPEDCGEATKLDAWRSRIGEGVNYLDVCRRSEGELAGEAAEFVEGIQAVLKGERTLYSKEYPCHSPNCQRWFLGRVTRFFSSGISRVVVEHINITERKQAEDHLRESEERFRTMADGCPIGIWVTDAQGVNCFANKAYLESSGITQDDGIDNRWRSIIHPDDAPGFFEKFERALKEHTPFHTERRSRRADGGWCWMESRGIPRFSSEGEFLGLAGTSADITDRKRAEEALQESEKRFRAMADGCPTPMWISGAEGGVNFTNRTFREFFGVPHEFAEGHKWQLLIHPDDLPEFAGEHSRAVRTHTTFKAEARVRRADGEWRWIIAHSEPRFSPSGEFLGHVGISTDITERKQAEQALKDSEEKFRQLAENINEVFWMMNAAGTEILYISPAYEQIWGRSCTSLYAAPMDWLNAIHPDDRQHAHETFMQQLQGEIIDSEYRIQTPDGQEKWICDRAFPVRDQNGELIRIGGVAKEITERKFADHALRSSEEKFRQLAENIREVFFIMSVPGPGLVYVNPAGEEVWGVSRESLYQNPMSWADAIHPDDQARARSLAARQLEGELVDSEFRILTPDGREKWIRSRTSPVRDQDGKVIRVVGIAEEITERKHFEAELINARKTAESANIAKSRFLANMSHEIRTPMNGVIGMNQLLLETELTAEQRRYVEVAQTSGRTLLSLIDNILDLSKIEAGGTTLENLEFGLGQAVDEVVQLLSVQAGAKGLRIVSRISPKIPELLRGDARRLSQVLMNLIANAIKFTERGAVTLDAELDSQSEKAATIRFTVSDTGIGIPEDKIPALFSPFVQADASTTRKYGGTGLGLAISKQLVEMMGGSIAVSSWEGQGSTFRFTVTFGLALDRRRSAPQSASFQQGKAIQSAVNSAINAAQRGHGERILIAEDNPTNREVILAQLKKLGYEGAMVANGAEAVEAVERESFDLVLMDCQMPLMDGYEATHRIRQSSHPQIPIIALTASAMSPSREKCLSEGMDDYLAKPVEFAHLAAVLAKWIRKPSADKETLLLQRPPDKPAKTIFNSDSLMSRLMGDRELACTVLKGFLKDVPSQLKRLCDRLDESDAPGTRFQAHTLKGAAATVGAEALHDVALAIETDASAARLERCPDLLVRAIDEFERFKSAVEQGGWNSKAIDNTGIEETSDV
ncbi:MAG: PAS domain S-box protein [Terracidiphilus sp.]